MYTVVTLLKGHPIGKQKNRSYKDVAAHVGCIETSWTWFVLSNNDLMRGIAIYREIYKEATAYLIPAGGGGGGYSV